MGQAGLLHHPWIARRKLDVRAYHRMAAAGILTGDDRVELIEGELVAMAPIGADHAGKVNRLTRLLVRAVGDRAVVAPQNPVRLAADSEPQPDFALLRPRADFYEGATPGPADILLLIEVAGSSLRLDREVKLPLYARHGVREVWIVDLEGQAIDMHRTPADGRYAACIKATRGARIAPEALPAVVLGVDEILG